MRLDEFLSGVFVTDADYLSEKLAREFYQEGVRILFTKPRANMKKMAIEAQNALCDSRAFIESVFRNLKMFDGSYRRSRAQSMNTSQTTSTLSLPAGSREQCGEYVK